MPPTRVLLAGLALAALGCSGGSGGPTPIEIPIARIEIVGNGCQAAVPGNQCKITAEAYTAENQQIGNPVLVWLSSDSSVASVDNQGLVTAKGAGNATIQVSNRTDTVSARVDIHVLPINTK